MQGSLEVSPSTRARLGLLAGVWRSAGANPRNIDPPLFALINVRLEEGERGRPKKEKIPPALLGPSLLSPASLQGRDACPCWHFVG